MSKGIQQLNARHYKIIECVLNGWTNKQIASHLDMAPNAISVIINSPSFQHEVSLRRATIDGMRNQRLVESDQDVTDAIKEGTRAAITKLVQSIESADENVAIRASVEVLDRGGFPRVSKIESKNLSVIMDADMLKVLQETIKLDKD